MRDTRCMKALAIFLSLLALNALADTPAGPQVIIGGTDSTPIGNTGDGLHVFVVGSTESTGGAATSALQSVGNASLATIAGQQTTGNASLAQIATQTEGLANQTTQAAIASYVSTIPASPATTQLQTAGNDILGDINASQSVANGYLATLAGSSGSATAANQVAGNAILSDINASQSVGNAALAAIEASTGNIPADPSTASLQTSGNSLLADINSNGSTANGDLSAIESSVANIPASPATTALQSAGNTELSSINASQSVGNAYLQSLVSASGGSATAALQSTGNASLAEILSGQSTGNSSLSGIQSSVANIPSNPSTSGLQTSGNAILSSILFGQTTGNSALSSIQSSVANIPASPATSSLQTTGNASLATIASTLTTTTATQALQATGNASLATIAANSTTTATASNQINGSQVTQVSSFPANTTPASQNITAQDVVTTSASGANNQLFYSGTPTTGSAAIFCSLPESASVEVLTTGTWTGTLQFEISQNGGTTWTTRGLKQSGASNISSSFTANFQGGANLAGMNCARVRSTAAWTGTSTVLLTAAVAPASVVVTNPLNLPLDRTASGNITAACAYTSGVVSSCGAGSTVQISSVGSGVVQYGTSGTWVATMTQDISYDPNCTASPNSVIWYNQPSMDTSPGSNQMIVNWANTLNNDPWVMQTPGTQCARLRAQAYTSGTVAVQLDANGSSFPNYTMGVNPSGQMAMVNTDANNNVQISQVPGTLNTYSGCYNGLSIPSSPTDIFYMTGSATKTVTINRVQLSGTETTVGMRLFNFITRSTADSGGTCIATVQGPLDQNDPAPTAVSYGCSVSPTTLGTLSAYVGATQFVLPATTGVDSSWPQITTWGESSGGQGVVLRGTSQTFAVNTTAVSAGSSLNVCVRWTEQ